MKIRADEHVSEEIVRAVREMAMSPDCEFTQVIETGDRSAQDLHWATKFAMEGGYGIVSGDTDFHKRPHLIVAIHKTGLRVIHMPSRWSNARCELQAAHMLLWWKRIEAGLRAMAAGDCYRPPWNLSEDGALAKVTMDLQDAERKLKREQQRAEKGKKESEGAESPS